ncbi:hypothetical protein F750_4942 [Streptomyces sp. PAMC 26508]|nr:hypothetical protein F750_4942 [Streptomyces sp. PAMC 26508]
MRGSHADSFCEGGYGRLGEWAGRAGGAWNGGRVPAEACACQDRVNTLAGSRPLPEMPCSLTGRFAVCHPGAVTETPRTREALCPRVR